ncbi:ABC transporter substrate-binding protein, partial [Pseudomonas sp.]|uniref:ABC transporter substrate-binding protein n=1 Tax=Pseudomonas sp. TaxID=306 RepID=UPI004053FAE4
GQPLGATIGFGTKADVVTAFSMDLNGNGITMSNAVWEEMKKHVPMADGKPVHPIKADALKPVIEQYKAKGKPFNLGMVFSVSTHNYELRYWLAAGGINPGYYAPAKGDITGTLTLTPCSRSPRRRKCLPPWKPALSAATASASRGIRLPCSKASAYR